MIPFDELALRAALDQLAEGRVVAAATESYFGLLADITNPAAVEALFGLKPRGTDKGVPTILPEASSWPALVAGTIPSLARAFADAFWPGGLSIALPAASAVSPRVALDGMLAVHSAAVEQSFADAIARGLLLVLKGESPGGAPSTVVRVSEREYAVARVGAVPVSALDEIARIHAGRA